MKNLPQLLKELQRRGFRVEYSTGSKAKLYPNDPTKPFYSLHIGQRAIHPLKRFSRQNWNLDLETI
jgi:hypothetical protein